MVKRDENPSSFKGVPGPQKQDGTGSGGGPFSGIYESAAFANILVEFETDNREMAVDVPDSFVAQTKTPPKYPPPSSLRDREEARSSGSSFSALSQSNRHSSYRGQSRQSQSPPELVTLPTPAQSERIKKYGEDWARSRVEQGRKAAQDEKILRLSIRNSQKLRALKGNNTLFHTIEVFM